MSAVALSPSAASTVTGRSGYLPALDGWRAVAIAAVIVCHGLGLAEPQAQGILGQLILNLGQQGVSLFFAISGYLITTLLLDEQKSLGRVSLRGFYIRRAFRILPPAYIYLSFVTILGLVGVITLARGEVLSAAFICTNYYPMRTWFTQHFWSLSMEEHFYLFWPSALAVLGVIRAKWCAVALIVLTLIWRPWSFAHVTLMVPKLQRTDMRLDAFLFACLLAILSHDRSARVFRMISTRPFHLGAMIVLAASYGIALLYPMQLTKLTIQSALLPLIVVPTVFLPNYTLSRVLEWAPLRWIGRISYGLYLWQQLVFHGDAPNLATAARWFPLKLAGLLLLTSVSYLWIEAPLIRFGRKLAKGAGSIQSRANNAVSGSR